jgi:hypothetical protein
MPSGLNHHLSGFSGADAPGLMDVQRFPSTTACEQYTSSFFRQ